MKKINFLMNRFVLGGVFSLFCLNLAAEPVGEKGQSAVKISGEIPEGWVVRQLDGVDPVSKEVSLKNGQSKIVQVQPFILQPKSKKTGHPLRANNGSYLNQTVLRQNISLVQSEQALSEVLEQMKALLAERALSAQ